MLRYSGFAGIEYYEASEVPLGDENGGGDEEYSGRDGEKSGSESENGSGGECGERGIGERGGEESGQSVGGSMRTRIETRRKMRS